MGTSRFYPKLHSTRLDKCSPENKDIIHLDDFNIDLLHYENDNHARIF